MYFPHSRHLRALIAAYFKHIKGEYHLEDVPAKGKPDVETIQQKVWDRAPEPATISGLAYYLGFDSRGAFEQYEAAGPFASTLKRGRLKVETEYEKKLHQSPSSGAIFALKNLGWHERGNTASEEQPTNSAFNINVIETTAKPVFSEKDVEV